MGDEEEAATVRGFVVRGPHAGTTGACIMHLDAQTHLVDFGPHQHVPPGRASVPQRVRGQFRGAQPHVLDAVLDTSSTQDLDDEGAGGSHGGTTSLEQPLSGDRHGYHFSVDVEHSEGRGRGDVLRLATAMCRPEGNCVGMSPVNRWGTAVVGSLRGGHQGGQNGARKVPQGRDRMGPEGIGELLTRLRDTSGMTHQRIADGINDRDGRATVTGKEVSRYLREKRIPSSRVRGYLSDLFGVELAILDRAAAVSRQRRGEPSSKTRIVEQAPTRRLLAADAAEAAEFARFLAGTNSSAAVLEGLHADVTRLARHYVSQPLAGLYGEIRTLRRATFALLEGRQRPSDTAELYLLAGRLCGLSAHVCLDAGDYDSAAAQSRTAWACADLVGHNGLRAWTRAAQSLIAFWNGSLRQAADLARAGQEFTAAGSIGARLAGLEARALAVAGDRDGAAAALATAQRRRESAADEDDFPGIFSFPLAKQCAYAGTTHLAIGGRRHVQAAITSAETAVRLYRSAEDADRSVGDLFAAHLDMARGHMKAGNVDGTEAMIGFVLDARPETRSASIARRLGEISGELDAPEFRDSTPVSHLRARLKEAAMAPAGPAVGREQQR